MKWSALCSSKSVGGMGFRDFQNFNNALLAKQVWRLLHHKDSLLFKVFSAKYFPNSSILEAPVHPRCFFAWRSILQTRDVINKDAVWRVGNGESIKILEHQWLQEHSNSKIVSPRTVSDVIFVKDLFLAGRRVWDPGLVHRLFLPWEADLICKIPVGEEPATDLLVWPLTPTGDYSVRSAYRLLESNAWRANPGSSSLDGQSKVWKWIWKIKTPNRIRHFIWRAARDSLPTKQNL